MATWCRTIEIVKRWRSVILDETLTRRSHPRHESYYVKQLESFSSISITVAVCVWYQLVQCEWLWKILQNNDRYAVEGRSRSAPSVQGHSRSALSVPIEDPFATFREWITYIIYRIIPRYYWLLSAGGGCLSSIHSKTGDIVLWYDGRRISISRTI